MCTCATALAILATLAILAIIETSTGAEMLKTEMHKSVKVCKDGFPERKRRFSCNLLWFSGLRNT